MALTPILLIGLLLSGVVGGASIYYVVNHPAAPNWQIEIISRLSVSSIEFTLEGFSFLYEGSWVWNMNTGTPATNVGSWDLVVSGHVDIGGSISGMRLLSIEIGNRSEFETPSYYRVMMTALWILTGFDISYDGTKVSTSTGVQMELVIDSQFALIRHYAFP